MELNLRFITPLWTANASGEMRDVEPTGLVGSLRWWYEALVRGLGRWVCDPTDSQVRCPAGQTVTLDNVQRVLCPACQLFGATGWARAFSLCLRAETTSAHPPTGEGRVDLQRPDGERSAWFFPPGQEGTVHLKALTRAPGNDHVAALVRGVLHFAQRNAALGAKTNLGYGLFEIDYAPLSPAFQPDAFVELLSRSASAGRSGPAGVWPDVRQMFFAAVQLETPWQPPDFVRFKYSLRQMFGPGPGVAQLVPAKGERAGLRHFVMGKTKRDDAQGSKIKMALSPDGSVLRLWGWIPDPLPGYVTSDRADAAPEALTAQRWSQEVREKLLRLVRKHIAAEGAITRWREFNSPRDSVEQLSDPKAYLLSLMEDDNAP